jgi:hypothetical protein
MWEMYAALLFDKIFGDEYFILRTSRFDDIARGVDMIIVHKETGEVVCAVDEVGVREGSRAIERKREKTEKANREGGKSVKYGLVKKDGKFVPGENRHVPVLYADITLDAFQDMLAGVSEDGIVEGESERALCARILDGLEAQFADMERIVVAEEDRRRADRSLREFEKAPLEGSPVKRNIWAAERRIADMRKILEDYQLK